VKLERRSVLRLTAPLKALLDRFAFGALIVLSIALLIVGRADDGLRDLVGTRITDALVPVLDVLNSPIEAFRRATDSVGAWVAVYEENARLRERNARLMEWQTVARQLALENEALRRMVGLDAEAEYPTAVAARVVADGGGPFVHTMLVNAGSDHGVREGMAAVDGRGLVGRVIEVGRRSARLLLLIDLNSRVPVLIEPSRDQAILAGDNSRQPVLRFLPLNPRVAVGDRVVTSGRGGVLPPGLAVGTVRAIDDDRVTVRTSVDWDRLEYVRLLDYAPVLPPEPAPDLSDEVFGPPLPPGQPAGEQGRPMVELGEDGMVVGPQP